MRGMELLVLGLELQQSTKAEGMEQVL